MKKAFTLVELLIVVVVIVTLMSMVFRLSSIGADQSARNMAVSRLQRLENCLSGYYAAFGSYPPVQLHGSRNYKLSACVHGIQGESESDLGWNWFSKTDHRVTSKENERRDWNKVKAACKAQPLDCCFPYPEDYSEFLGEMSKDMSKKSSSNGISFGAVTPANLSTDQDETDWRRVQCFKFGLMSYLLPRYLVMMRGDEKFFDSRTEGGMEQWLANNTMPCDPIKGYRFDERDMDDDDEDWTRVREYAISTDPMKLAHVQNIPSQAVCARWMPNLEGICAYNFPNFKFFGIDIRDQPSKDNPGMIQNRKPEVHVAGDRGGNCQDGGNSGGGASGGSGQYVLDRVTVYDGFSFDDEDGDGMTDYGEFFYYSPEPYQSYVLWSAGPNGRTFPPWVPRESLSAQARECVGYWTEDDIVIMSH